MTDKERIRALEKIIKENDKHIHFLEVRVREEISRAQIFEDALKSKQNYYIPSNSHWYRKDLNSE